VPNVAADPGKVRLWMKRAANASMEKAKQHIRAYPRKCRPQALSMKMMIQTRARKVRTVVLGEPKSSNVVEWRNKPFKK